MAKWVILADDLTGACDTGAAFAASGLETVVALDPTQVPDAQVLVLNSASRSLNEPQAVQSVRQVLRHLAGRLENALVYKKIDSTLRGHPAAELTAVMEVTGVDTALVTPAFPEQGRTVIDGRVLVYGRRLEETAFGQEVSSGDLTRMLEGRLLRLDNLRREDGTPGNMLKSGAGIWTADSQTTADLARVAAAGLSAGVRLWCGSAGLARSLVRLSANQGTAFPGLSVLAGGPVLVVAGSRHPTTQGQLARLEQSGVRVLDLPCFGSTSGVIDEMVERAVREIQAGKNAALSVRGLEVQAQAEQQVAGALSRAAARILEAVRVARLVVTGGDTAAAVCRELGCTHIRLLGEVRPGIAFGHLMNGRSAGLEVITKAGGFGGEDSLIEIL